MNTTLDNLKINLFGESHGPLIGITVAGLASGIKLDLKLINDMLERRKPKGKISTQRQESDQFKIVSGYFNGYTTGTPLTIIIENKAQQSKDYSKIKDILRPSHADFTAYEKYQGFQDYRGGGHFSGRLTAPIVALGAIATQILNSHNIKIATQIKSIKNIQNISFINQQNLETKIDSLNKLNFPVLDQEIKNKMHDLILATAKNHDSVGGTLESIIIGLDPGYGEPFFNSIESKLSHLIFSIPGVKGIEFGLGFAITNYYGSEINDSFWIEHNSIKTKTNNNGGLNGGISNGMPILLTTAVKPTPSIFKEQNTVNYKTKEETKFTIEGRHDPAIIHRAAVVQSSMIAIGILDTIISREGYLWMVKK